MTGIYSARKSLPKQPFEIPFDLFMALSPLDQMAARALQRVGDLRITGVPPSEQEKIR